MSEESKTAGAVAVETGTGVHRCGTCCAVLSVVLTHGLCSGGSVRRSQQSVGPVWNRNKAVLGALCTACCASVWRWQPRLTRLTSVGPWLLLLPVPECMQVGWYNELVDEKYAIHAQDDVVALALVSTPTMWLRFKEAYGSKSYPSDPVDCWCRDNITSARAGIAATVPALVRLCCGGVVWCGVVVHSVFLPSIYLLPHALTLFFRCPRILHPALQTSPQSNGQEGQGTSIEFLSEGWDRSRFQPFVLVQTVGHVAGAARLYRPDDVTDRGVLDAWVARREEAGEPSKLFPVAIHPRFGGWFAYRGVLVCRTLKCPGLPRPAVPDPLPSSEGRTRALIKFNEGWTDRELGMEVEATYEDEAVEYFGYKTPRSRKAEILAGFKAANAKRAAASEGV